ncbi:MAG: S8 family peptidase, partial [Planctomycetaceae bacterium]|nr:S8 family peptidase [Planctomycetaceae bacterium]
TAKSYFPTDLLREARMEAIGSRPSRTTPEKWTRKGDPEELPTTELFVAARREDFDRFAKGIPSLTADNRCSRDLFKVEEFRAPTEKDRVQKFRKRGPEPMLEVVLHTSGMPPARILEAFEAFAESLGLDPLMDRRFDVSGLSFLPIRAARDQIGELSQFSFLRTIREMPGLRPLRPIIRASAKTRPFPVQLPTSNPVDKQLRAAVFDGGISTELHDSEFAVAHEPGDIGAQVDGYVDHGTGVTSTLLFGPLAKDVDLPQPYGAVDHYRVLDEHSSNDPLELYDALNRIKNVLQSRRYQFVNLSIGPALPIEDHEVHAWTAVLDSILADGETLTTIAVGNDGEQDHESGNARVQVPSDSVNSLAIGAADSHGTAWKRAPYSCIGPGRSPGLIKPEVIAFGGCAKEPFFVLDQSTSIAIPDAGTSYASPYALRMGMGVRAHFGNSLSTLAIKSLLVHCSEPSKKIPVNEIGWGRVAQDLDALVICSDGEARVVYQGELTPGHYLRTPVPLPTGKLEGMLTLTATFCFACETDPEDPSNYTRGGLDITFRPHADKFDEESVHPKSASFFRRSDFDTEKELRLDAHKWETTLHRRQRFYPKTLKDPVFDVHYQVREAGKPSGGEKIKYALIITLSAPKVTNLYQRIVQRYQTQLEPIVPLIDVPIRVR